MFLNASARLQPFASQRNVSFAANCFRRTEVNCVKKLALLHEFDDNVAVVATTVASITTGIVQLNCLNPAMCNRSGATAALQIRLRIDM